MKTESQTVSMKIFISSTDKFRETPLYEAIALEAKQHGIAGATILKGFIGFGASSRTISKQPVEAIDKAPVIIEMIDDRHKLEVFLKQIQWLFDEAKKGYTITITPAEVLVYKAGEKGV